jgi:hypothetical protein
MPLKADTSVIFHASSSCEGCDEETKKGMSDAMMPVAEEAFQAAKRGRQGREMGGKEGEREKILENTFCKTPKARALLAHCGGATLRKRFRAFTFLSLLFAHKDVLAGNAST